MITDRRVLDRQLQDAVYQIEHAQGVVKAIDEDSQQLAQALVDGTRIVITTLQKFPFVMKGLLAPYRGRRLSRIALGGRAVRRRLNGARPSPTVATRSSSTRRTPVSRARAPAR